MIRMTDNLKMTDSLYELRKLVLRDLMKMGYKYIARDKEGALFAYSRKPIKLENERWILGRSSVPVHDKLEDISLVSRIFHNIEWENIEPFKIIYTNWKEVPVNTPVVITSVSGRNYVLHFCKYDEKNDRVVLYKDGRTSFIFCHPLILSSFVKPSDCHWLHIPFIGNGKTSISQ